MAYNIDFQLSLNAYTKGFVGISDAPEDNKLYGRKDKHWVEIPVDEFGKIDTIKKNGETLPIIDKTVDIFVPTSLTELTEDNNHKTVSEEQINIWNNKQNSIEDLNDIRSKADSAIQPNDNITELNNNAGYITQTYADNKYPTKDYVDNEDNYLQQQIDGITAASDVVDVVGTYAELEAYDTSHLKDNDIIKVLQDETRNDAITYYRWVVDSHTHEGIWQYVGQEGPYYTKGDTNILLDAKQDSLTAGNNITIEDNIIAANVPVSSVNNKTGAVQLKASDVNAVSLGDPIIMQTGYITTTSSPVDLTPSTYPGSPWRCAVIPCTKGDKFTLNVQGGDGSRAWCLINNDNEIVNVAPIGTTLINSEFIIEDDSAAKLIINDRSGTNISYYGRPLSSYLEEQETEILNIVDNKIADNNVDYLRYAKAMHYQNNNIVFGDASSWFTYLIPIKNSYGSQAGDYYKLVLQNATIGGNDLLNYAFVDIDYNEVQKWEDIPESHILLKGTVNPADASITNIEVQAPENSKTLLITMAKNKLLPLAIPCVKMRLKSDTTYTTITKDLDIYDFNDLKHLTKIDLATLDTDGSIKIIGSKTLNLFVLKNKETSKNIKVNLRYYTEGSGNVYLQGIYNSEHLSSYSTGFELSKNYYEIGEWRFPFFEDFYDILQLRIVVPANCTLHIKDFNVIYENINTLPEIGARLDAHLGYQIIAPENTMSSYISAAKMGYKYCITNIKSTSDGIFVCCHDASINHSAKNTDGSELSETVYVKSKTYQELLDYDFGSKLGGAAFKGEKIPTYEQFLQLCCRTGMHPIYSCHGIVPADKFDNPTYTDLTLIQIEELKDMLIKYNLLQKFNPKLDIDTLSDFYSIFQNQVEEYIIILQENQVPNLSTIISNIQSLNIPSNKVCIEFPLVITSGQIAIPLEANIKTVHDYGYRVSVWNVYSTAGLNYNKLVSYGVNGFTDDRNGCNGLNW